MDTRSKKRKRSKLTSGERRPEGSVLGPCSCSKLAAWADERPDASAGCRSTTTPPSPLMDGAMREVQEARREVFSVGASSEDEEEESEKEETRRSMEGTMPVDPMRNFEFVDVALTSRPLTGDEKFSLNGGAQENFKTSVIPGGG